MKGHRFIIGRKLCEIASTLEKKRSHIKTRRKLPRTSK